MSETDEVSLLEGAGIEPVLVSATSILAGALKEWSLSALHHRPGAGVTGIYAVQCATADGPVNGFLCVTTRTVAGEFPRAVRLRGPGGLPLLAWSHPHDPLLPSLGWACDAQSVGRDLFGVRAATLTTLSYRPMRRAVLRAEGAGEARYVKVLQRGHADALRRRHELLLDAGVPVPQPLAFPGRDVLVTLPAAGTSLAQLFLKDGARELEPQVLLDLLDRLPPAACDLPARSPWSAHALSYAQAAMAVLPFESPRITRLASAIQEDIRTAPAGPVVATHGDFYEGNLLVEHGRISAVLDLDGVGPGHLVDDLACFLAHLAVLPCVDDRYTGMPAVLARFQRAFEDRVDAAALRARAAGVALTLVAGARNTGLNQSDGGWQAGALRRLSVAESFLHGGSEQDRQPS